jgi:hypothetical protein
MMAPRFVRVFDAVEQYDSNLFRRGRALHFAAARMSSSVARGARSNQAHDALVIFRICQAIQLAAVLEAHRDISLPRQLYDLFDGACPGGRARFTIRIEGAVFASNASFTACMPVSLSMENGAL